MHIEREIIYIPGACKAYTNTFFLPARNSLSVMYGSADLFALSCLRLSRGIVSHILLIVIYIECTTIHNAHPWVPF